MPNVKGSFLGRVPLVLADFRTSDRLSERSRSADAFSGTRARGTPASKRRCISLALPRRGPGAAAASLAAISLYGVFFGLSLGPIPNIYTAESFPTRAPAPDAAAGSGGPDRTSSLSSSVASKSIRPDGGRVDGPRRPLDGRRHGRVDVVRTRARRGRVAYVAFPRRHARSAAMTASLARRGARRRRRGGEVAAPRAPREAPRAPQAAQFASHAAVSFYFPVVVARRGPRAAFAAFAAVCGVTWVFVRAAVPETAQASLEDLATRAA